MNTRRLIRACVPRSLRNWLRTPAKSAQYVWDRLVFALGTSRTVEIRKDWVIRVHPAARDHFAIFCTDPVQASELDAFIQHCPPGIQLLDIGAHYGFFALAALRYGGPDASVLCVEASPGAAKVLHSTLELNDCGGRVQVRNVAMGAEDGMLPMLTTGPLGGDYFVVPSEEREDTILVPQRSLASLIEETGFRPSHIKLDIEGFEYEVIEAGIPLLRSLRPVLFLELHGTALEARKKDPAAVIEMLKQAGYEKFSLGEGELTPDQMAKLGYNCRMICA